MHFWFGDERWLPQGDPERNDTTVRAALLDHIELPAENVHAMGASDAGLSLDEAVAAYTAELAAHANGETGLPGSTSRSSAWGRTGTWRRSSPTARASAPWTPP